MSRPRKRFWRRLFASRPGQRFLGGAIATYIWLVHVTGRVRFDTHPEAQPYLDGDKPAIFAFWHGRMLLMARFCPPKRRMWVVISTHRDGEWISRAMHNFGLGSLRGSSHRGAHAVLRRALDRLQKGENVSITPDGPRGPREVAQPGAVGLASLAGLPVIPVSFAAGFGWRARSWDRFLVAFPFSILGFAVGEPLFVTAGANDGALSAASLQLTDRLLEATRAAELLTRR